jgi:hypothetical protein
MSNLTYVIDLPIYSSLYEDPMSPAYQTSRASSSPVPAAIPTTPEQLMTSEQAMEREVLEARMTFLVLCYI